MPKYVLVVLFALAAGSSVGAHDFWLAAAPWAPASGKPVTFTANVGEKFPHGTSFTAAERVGEWRVLGPNGPVAVQKTFRRAGESLATDVVLPAPGAYLGVMTVAPRTIEMTGDEFTKYLAEEGLTQIIAARKTAGETAKATKEKYARYAKVAVRTGPGAAPHLTRPAGLPAEFVPSTDPTTVHPGSRLTLQLLAGGKPVSGAAVRAVSAAGGMPLDTRSDADGRVSFTLDSPGAWLVKTIHMVRLPAGAEAEWESFWVTLSFSTAAH